MRRAGSLVRMGRRYSYMGADFWRDTMKEREFVRPRNIWNNNNYNSLKEIRRDGLDCIHRREERDKWRAFENTVMNLRFYKIRFLKNDSVTRDLVCTKFVRITACRSGAAVWWKSRQKIPRLSFLSTGKSASKLPFLFHHKISERHGTFTWS